MAVTGAITSAEVAAQIRVDPQDSSEELALVTRRHAYATVGL